MNKNVLRAAASVLAAVTMLTTVSYAESGTFFTPLAKLASSQSSEKSGTASYVTPMTVSTTTAKYKAFVAAKPEKLSLSSDSWGDRILQWEPVENAILYYVYRKEGGNYKLIGKTAKNFYQYYSETSYTYSVPEGKYYVRAVTYNYNDKRIFSKKSDVYTVTAPKPVYYEYDDYGYYDEAADYEDGYDEEADFPADASINSVASAGAVNQYEADDDDDYYSDDDDEPAEEDLSNEEYSRYDVDGFRKASDTPLSTFSADVDTASYANVRRLANDGSKIPADAVRIEEFLNYFDYKYQQPKNNFTLTYEYTDCPWNSKAKLLMMGLQTKDITPEPNSNLVFLIDVSGSMYSKDKLPLVQEALKKLVNETTSKDRISVVTYSGMEQVVVAGARGNMKNCISDVADSLDADGVTNGERGINMAYDIAKRYFIKNGSNRVIMATDGDLNVGISDKDKLSEFIAEKRETGVYLTVLGFGTGNLKDDRMEALAKDGNGNYHYIDCAAEATKVLVDERKKTLVTVADDVKLQVEFNPTLVDSYKLIGYDGRKLKNEDFTNDKKDAADMGAGQSITVMYEIIPATSSAETLKYQTSKGNQTDICTVKVRYKKPGETKSKQSTFTVKKSEYLTYSKTGIRFKFAACVAEVAMALKGDSSYGSVSVKNAAKRFAKLSKTELAQIGYSDDFEALLGLVS